MSVSGSEERLVVELLEAGRLEEARALLGQLVAGLPGGTHRPAELARLSLRAGLSTAAIRCLQVALQEDHQDADARRELALLYEERGELQRADAVRRGLPEVSGPESSPGEAPLEDADPSDADLLRFLDRFEGREGVHARMWHDADRGTGYSPVRAPITLDLVRSHLAGTLTLGVYVVRADQTVRFVVLDVDAERKAMEAAMGDPDRLARLRAAVREVTDRLRSVLVQAGLDPLLVDSGYKGRHLWVLLDRPVPAGEALRFGRWAVSQLAGLPPGVHVDIFPRQAEVGPDGLGNLVKLPLGIHRRSGRRSWILAEDHQPLARPFARLASIARRALPALPGAWVAEPMPVAAEEELPPAVARPATPAWTEASYDRSAWVPVVLRGCAVIRHVIEGGLAGDGIDPAAPVVLNHTLGHLPDGPAAVNYLYDRVGGVATEARMGAPHRGMPMGCAKVRSKLAAVVGRGVPCSCTFPSRPGAHAHPLRHLDDLPAAEPPPTLDDVLERYAAQLHRLQQVQGEVDELRVAALGALREVPGGAWAVNGGEWRLTADDAGDPVLTFHGSGG